MESRYRHLGSKKEEISIKRKAYIEKKRGTERKSTLK